MSGILFFIFDSCEPLTLLSICYTKSKKGLGIKCTWIYLCCCHFMWIKYSFVVASWICNFLPFHSLWFVLITNPGGKFLHHHVFCSSPYQADITSHLVFHTTNYCFCSLYYNMTYKFLETFQFKSKVLHAHISKTKQNKNKQTETKQWYIGIVLILSTFLFVLCLLLLLIFFRGFQRRLCGRNGQHFCLLLLLFFLLLFC